MRESSVPFSPPTSRNRHRDCSLLLHMYTYITLKISICIFISLLRARATFRNLIKHAIRVYYIHVPPRARGMKLINPRNVVTRPTSAVDEDERDARLSLRRWKIFRNYMYVRTYVRALRWRLCARHNALLDGEVGYVLILLIRERRGQCTYASPW